MNNRVLIGIPCRDSVDTKFAFSLVNLFKPEGTEVVFEVAGDVARSRNLIVERAIKGGFTHVLFIDSDMKFNPDMLERLLDHDVDIVGVMYHQRRLPLRNNVMPLDAQDAEGQSKTVDMTISEALFEVKWVGTGIMLVKTEVFKALKAPLFTFIHDGDYIGEDVYFCRKAREAGYKILVDAEIVNRHIGEFEF